MLRGCRRDLKCSESGRNFVSLLGDGEDVAEAIEIGRDSGDKFEVEAEYDLARFSNAIEHIERDNRNGAILLSSAL